MQSAGILLAISALVLGLSQRKKHQEKTKQDRLVKRAPPSWAQPYTHMVPPWLVDTLNWYDWTSLRDVNSFALQRFCTQKELDAFADPVVLSLTTSPERLKYVGFVLSLLDLTYVTRIEISLPRRFGRTNAEYGPIPGDLSRNDKVFICWQDDDWGPIMKLLPAAQRAQQAREPDTIIVTIDDDICYPRDTITMLVSAQIATKGRAVVGGMGAPIDAFLKSKDRDTMVRAFRSLGPQAEETCKTAPHVPNLVVRELVEGFGAVSYRAHHVDIDRCLALTRLSRRCFQSDDLVISAMLQRGGICRMRPTRFKVHGFSFGNEADALHVMQDHNLHYSECIAAILGATK